jgi:hypothetical protein
MFKFTEFAKKKDEAMIVAGSGKKVRNVGPDAQVWGAPGEQSNQTKSDFKPIKSKKEGFRAYHDARESIKQLTAEEVEQSLNQ